MTATEYEEQNSRHCAHPVHPVQVSVVERAK